MHVVSLYVARTVHLSGRIPAAISDCKVQHVYSMVKKAGVVYSRNYVFHHDRLEEHLRIQCKGAYILVIICYGMIRVLGLNRGFNKFHLAGFPQEEYT